MVKIRKLVREDTRRGDIMAGAKGRVRGRIRIEARGKTRGN